MARKILLTILFVLLLSAASFFLFFSRAQVERGWEVLQARCHQFLYQKEFHFEGLQRVPSAQLARLLPLERSVIWWSLRPAEIESALGVHPLVSGAKIRRCEVFSIGCFVIEVREREPAAIAAVGSEAWIVGRDGVFIAPLSSPEALTELFGGGVTRLNRLPLIGGVMPEKGSLEVGKSRLRHVLSALALIEAESGYPVSSLSIGENGEVTASFRGYGVKAVFDAIKGQNKRLRREARRFRQVMKEFAGREAALESVDLAFDKLAVIKLVEGASAKKIDAR